MAGYSTLAPTQTLPTTKRGGYTSPGVYRQALGGPQVGPRDYQYSLDPGQEAELQTSMGISLVPSRQSLAVSETSSAASKTPSGKACEASMLESVKA